MTVVPRSARPNWLARCWTLGPGHAELFLPLRRTAAEAGVRRRDRPRRAALAAATVEIRAVEDELPADLDPGERERFLHALQRAVVVRLERMRGAPVTGTDGCG